MEDGNSIISMITTIFLSKFLSTSFVIGAILAPLVSRIVPGIVHSRAILDIYREMNFEFPAQIFPQAYNKIQKWIVLSIKFIYNIFYINTVILAIFCSHVQNYETNLQIWNENTIFIPFIDIITRCMKVCLSFLLPPPLSQTSLNLSYWNI